MKCQKCHTEMQRLQYGEHKYGYICPKCGKKIAIPEQKEEEVTKENKHASIS